jgi:hypothetical protein
MYLCVLRKILNFRGDAIRQAPSPNRLGQRRREKNIRLQ